MSIFLREAFLKMERPRHLLRIPLQDNGAATAITSTNRMVYFFFAAFFAGAFFAAGFFAAAGFEAFLTTAFFFATIGILAPHRCWAAQPCATSRCEI